MSALPIIIGVVIGALIWFKWYRPWQNREFYRTHPHLRKRTDEVQDPGHKKEK